MARRHANAGIGADNWIYIASDALSNFREEGGAITIREGGSGLIIELPGITAEDPRIIERLRELVISADIPGGSNGEE